LYTKPISSTIDRRPTTEESNNSAPQIALNHTHETINEFAGLNFLNRRKVFII